MGYASDETEPSKIHQFKFSNSLIYSFHASHPLVNVANCCLLNFVKSEATAELMYP